MTKRRIAVLISLMLAAPAAVVALEQAASSESAEAQPAQEIQAEATAPATTSEPIAATEQQPAPAEQPVAMNPVSRILGSFQRATRSDTFPEGSMYGDYNWKPLPSQVQYFANLERQRGSLIARGDSFPDGSGGELAYKPLPAQVAYFDRQEQQRLASAQPQPVARAEVTPPSSEQSAQAGSAELAMADSSAIR